MKLLRWCLPAGAVLAAVAFGSSCTRTSVRSAPEPLPSAAPTGETPVLSGAIYRGAVNPVGKGLQVSNAVASQGAQVYVRSVQSSDWVGPVITDQYGRFVFKSLAPGKYQARAYTGPIRIWDQVVTVPSTLSPVVVRDVTVVYYRKDTDAGRVETTLEMLAFPYESRSPQNHVPTNTVMFGHAVSLADIKALAAALVRAGIPIASIREFRDNNGTRAKLVEIEGDAKRMHDHVFTGDQIDSARGFIHS